MPSRCARPRSRAPSAGWRSAGVAAAVVLWSTALGMTAPPRPPEGVVVEDRPNDGGTGLIVRWSPSPDDQPDEQPRRVRDYEIRRCEVVDKNGQPVPEPEWKTLGVVPAGGQEFVDGGCRAGVVYRYLIVARSPAEEASTPAASEDARPIVQWFDRTKLSYAAIVAFVCGAVMFCTERARRGHPVYVRPIAALNAIDEAVGRATEMGRPMLFVPGIMDLDQIETVAGLTVLSHVSRKAAEYDTPLEVPTSRVLVMTAAQEMSEAACLAAGRPEAYDSDRIHYVTDDQFGYVAHVCGWMLRQKPAACFYLGKFFAESLIFAETGRSVGAIQIGGTAEAAQLPFFIAACDYTLIGEELFAASAYLSGEPQQLGTVQGQDWGKFLAGGLLLVGSGLATLLVVWPEQPTLQSAWRLLHDVLLVTGGGG